MFPRTISTDFQGGQLFKNAFFLFISPQISAYLRYEHLPLLNIGEFPSPSGCHGWAAAPTAVAAAG
jgi:hypothetical protein